ncbi:unnamed protein product [Lactuca virosa]|uniref:peptidylprolyl isomerase n=1 Tax=Lactuca virosa TaxID=75947 RepID=A0AAU9NZB0_9ASTR|nr:unnamed protein product [Lactuca virosa]
MDSVHYVGSLVDGTTFISTREKGEPFSFKISQVLTMKKGEIALFTLPPQLGFGVSVTNVVPPNSIIQFEIELLSWIAVLDACKDGGILKRVVKKGEETGQPGDLDEYVVKLPDGVIIYESPKEGVEFYLKDDGFGEEGVTITSLPNGFSPIPPNSMLHVELELAVDYVSEEGEFGDYDEKVVKSLRVSCWLNAAACSLKLDDHKNAIILCSKVVSNRCWMLSSTM